MSILYDSECNTMGRANKNPQKPPQNMKPRVTESHLRLAFLEQAARLLTSKSKSPNDGPSLLSKMYMDEFKEVKFVQQTLTDKDVNRNNCQKCRRVFTPDASGDTGFIIKINKDYVHRKCTDCGNQTRYPRNSKYQSRNERQSEPATS